MYRPPPSTAAMAARLFAQTDGDPAKVEALLEAAYLLAVSRGHEAAGRRFRATVRPSLARERRTLEGTTRPREEHRGPHPQQSRHPGARPPG